MFRAGDPGVATTHVRLVPGDDDTYIVDGPGVSHDSLLEEPHVEAVASVFTQLLDRASGELPRERGAH